jgi:hypothetical protein
MTQQWILGYLSGVAMDKSAVSEAIGQTDAAGIFAWIDNYCRQNPLDRIDTAASLLVLEMSKQ